MTAIRSARPSTSSSSVETSTTAVPSSRSRDDPPVHELHRADVQAAGRLGDDQQLQRPGQLAGQHDLLLVAAGQRARGGARATGVRTSNSSTRVLRVARDLAEVEAAARGERRLVVHVEHEVLGDRERADQPVVQAVLGHVADAEVEHLGRCRASVTAWPSIEIAPLVGRRRPTSASVSSVWPLPCTPAIA